MRLRDRVVANGGRLELGMREVRDEFARTLLDAPARSEIALALRDAGLVADPPLEEARRHDRLQLSAKPRRGTPRSATGHSRPAESVEGHEGDPALGSVALAGLVATVAGFAVFGLVGGLLLLGASLLLIFLVAGTDWSARRSILVVAISLLLLSFLVISPLTADEPSRTPNPSKAGTPRVSVLRASAIRELDSGNYANALRIAEEDLRDLNLARRIRDRAARELLDRAERAIDTSPRRTLTLARRSANYKPSARAEEIKHQAQGLVAAEQAASEPPPPAEPADPLPEDPLDSEPAEEDFGGGGGSDGSSGFNCGPGDIDGDGDGRCNE